MTAALRASIHAADPIGFMAKVMNGHMPNLDEQGQPDGTFEVANQTSRMQAAQFLAKRIAPEAKETPIEFDIGHVEAISDAVAAIGQVTKAVASGKLNPSEGKVVCDMLSTFVRVFEVGELATRLEALEAAIEGEK